MTGDLIRGGEDTERKSCEDRGRDGSYITESKGKHGKNKCWESQDRIRP